MDLSLPFERRIAWNLTVLQRRDPSIVRIVGSASFVSLYKFDSSSRTWSRIDVEGCLFLVRRTAEPTHQMIVLNKMSPEDHVVGIVEETDFEVNDTYLMITTPEGDIEGYWFFDAQERELFALQLQKILQGEPMHAAIPGGGQGATMMHQTTATQTSSSSSSSSLPPHLPMPHMVGGLVGGYYAPVPHYFTHGPPPNQDADDRLRLKRVLISLIENDHEFFDKIYREFQYAAEEEED